MHFIVTGHTGFKGTWLLETLKLFGHTFSGISLDVPRGGLYNELNLAEFCVDDLRLNLGDSSHVGELSKRLDGDVLIHFAAQPLVSVGYSNPDDTFSANVFGTINALTLAERLPSLQAVLVITTDKVYRWSGQNRAYLEDDPLGPLDPYGSSKAMADLYAQSWFARNKRILGGIVRAGNVIGIGDPNSNRLLPSIQDAVRHPSRELRLRKPEAVRPWQHVIECIDAYLQLLDACIAGKAKSGEVWNIGPSGTDDLSVKEIVETVERNLGYEFQKSTEQYLADEELSILRLDSRKFRQTLGWRGSLRTEDAIRMTILSADAFGPEAAISTMRKQIEEYNFSNLASLRLETQQKGHQNGNPSELSAT